MSDVDEDAARPEADVHALLGILKARVEERRGSGEYPPGLEDDLDAHFRSIVRRGQVRYELDVLRARLDDVEKAARFNPAKIPLESGVPGGAALHKTIAKIVSRQTQGVIEQVQEFADAVRRLLGELITIVDNPGTHVHTDLVGQIDLALDRLASYEATPADPKVADAELRRRVEILEATERRREYRPWFSNSRFEEEFRGSREELLSRYQDLAERMDGCAPVVDIGCGRGEFIELLHSKGIEAYGIEVDVTLVHEAKDAGLPVDFGDAVSWLAAQPDASLGGITLMQVIEHLTAQEAVDVVALSAEKLRRGGRIIVETVNPQSLYVFAHSFYLDPTHHTPVHPAYLHFLFREAGFSQVEMDWRSPPPADDVLRGDDGLSAGDAERLNRLLFAPQDYAIIATR